MPAFLGAGGRVPPKPMCGTVGRAPAAPGLYFIVPPRAVSGNMDLRRTAAGTELYLPVEMAGGLLSLSDAHAARGDREICGTAIETACPIAARIDLLRNAHLRAPRLATPGPVTRHLDSEGCEVTTGDAPELRTAARDAVAAMVDLLAVRHGMRVGCLHALFGRG